MYYSRKYLILILVLISGLTATANDNDTLNSENVEALSYNYYLNKQWNKLGNFCEYAIGKGYDYYYIRVRAGVAFFELKTYRKSTIHLEKAVAFNPSDFALSYLYYSYIYTQRYEDANRLNKVFSAELKQNGILPAKAISFIGLEGGTKQSSNPSVYGHAVFSQLNLSHVLPWNASAFHALSFYKQDEWRFSVKQYQYYFQNKFALKRNYDLAIGIHAVYSDVVVYDTLYIYPDPLRFPPPPIKKAAYQTNTQTLGLIAALQLTKHFSIADINIGTTETFLDSAKQYQANAGICFYPFGNNKLSIGGNVHLHALNNLNDISIAWAPYASIYLGKRCNLALTYFANNGYNITEYNGYFVNNSVDRTASRIAGSMSFLLTNKFQLYGSYVYENKVANEINSNYHYQVYMLGIRFYP